ncbi:esterase [Mycobacterium phage Pocahontas]|uniref:Hydrolase n=1 Tax=Mycobacterium phage Veracruz TaxID=2530154 RepID=A0A481VSP9_9CAUD|nr:esterase/lipase [Mycobacterium phage Veracruz]AIS73735.1 esterase/lipase [Mycobacterium phage QuinnKiro]AOT24210.1 esterase [Mycobacterium phage Todacoro]AYR03440.1 hydrolase [Mycobacterium phage Popcicle]AZV00625.1 esterase [Mycobacterium phage Norbert]QDP44926.1 esterase [Mycobacterium phage Pocahontas]
MTLKHKTLVLEDGFRVAVATAGDRRGLPLVFLHGLTVSAGAYVELLEGLAGVGFYVVAPDAANHGGTGSLPWGHTVADMAEVVARLCSALDIAQAVIVGHSMGGGMAVEFAAAYPERTIAAVLLDAAAGQEHHDNIKVGKGSTIPWRAAQRLAAAFVDVIGDGYAAMRVRDPLERLSLLDTLRQSVSSFRFVRAAYALMRADTVPLLEKMAINEIPTAVIHGDLDQIIPFASGVSAAAAADADLYVVEGGFHSWMLAEPALAVELIITALMGFNPQRYLLGAE